MFMKHIIYRIFDNIFDICIRINPNMRLTNFVLNVRNRVCS